jgi:predicted nucleic acid-binding protein
MGLLREAGEQTGCGAAVGSGALAFSAMGFGRVAIGFPHLTRRVRPAISPGDARRFLDSVLVPLWRVMPTPSFYRRGLELQARYGFSFYDALIVAAALDACCTRLCSEDLQHG